jgi:hypothetical protein
MSDKGKPANPSAVDERTATERERCAKLLEGRAAELADPQGRSVAHAFVLWHLNDLLKKIREGE